MDIFDYNLAFSRNNIVILLKKILLIKSILNQIFQLKELNLKVYF
jgi:hypothetical protein